MAASLYIPEEIFTKIFTSLHEKSLLRFRCVCKSWFSLIDTAFGSKTEIVLLSGYDTYCPNRTAFSATAILTNTFKSFYCGPRAETATLVSLKDFHANPNEPTSRRRFNIILGSCNGILCVVIDTDGGDNVMLWNPTINKCRVLPPRILRDKLGVDVGGIGYDSSTANYKVVCVNHVAAQVFSMKFNSWKTIQVPFPRDSFRESYSVFTNGCIYMSGYGKTIKSFHVGTERFEEISISNCVSKDDDDNNVKLLVLGGKLGFADMLSPCHIPLWLLSECGSEKTWTKIASLTACSSGHSPCKKLSPVSIMDSGRAILLEEKKKNSQNIIEIFIYKPIGGTESLDTRLLDVKVLSTSRFVVPYVWSLISPTAL